MKMDMDMDMDVDVSIKMPIAHEMATKRLTLLPLRYTSLAKGICQKSNAEWLSACDSRNTFYG